MGRGTHHTQNNDVKSRFSFLLRKTCRLKQKREEEKVIEAIM
jgi:hypothetical protein